MISKILVPLDGSTHAAKALDFAIDLAEKYPAEIVLLSVVPPVVIPVVGYSGTEIMPISPVDMEEYSKEMRASHERVLSEALKRVREWKPKIIASSRCVEGRPADKIVEIAKEGGFDLIVMGNRGLGGIKEFFLGSVSHRVADQASCPILIIK